MKIREITESKERCVEAGWFAYDFLLEDAMEKAFIINLRGIGGSFVFLEMLKKPFFKLEADHYILKGVMGNDFFRMAVHADYVEKELERVKRYIGRIEEAASAAESGLTGRDRENNGIF